MRRTDERGVATVLMVGVLAVVMLVSGAAMLIAGYALGHHRARAAADLAALSAAAVFEQGGDGCAQARRTAVANGAKVTNCEQIGDIVDFVFTVEVTLRATIRVAGLPGTIRAEAHAGPVH